jgi:hypothetical protein
MDRMTTALLWAAALVVGAFLTIMVVGNDEGSTTEVGMLNGGGMAAALVRGTDSECDALYHAIWKVKQEPSHSTLISLAIQLDCPLSE